LFHLEPMEGTWTSFEVQKAVQLGYVIECMYEVHHFEHRSNSLFRAYNETFFEIKRRAKVEGNKGLEAVAKMCINGPTGKWGFNPSKQMGVRLVTETADFFKYLCGKYDKVTLQTITEEVSVARLSDNDHMTEHSKSNVYISAFITGYARMKLYEDALEVLQEKVLYFDTDSVIYVSPTGEHLITPDTTGALGLWTSELKVGDYYTEFVSAGPKTYCCKSFSGDKDVAKSKGFSLHYKNQQIFNFESLKEQVFSKVRDEHIEKLVLHLGEDIMRKDRFQVAVEPNRGKVINMVYDKRVITPVDDIENITCVDTLPHGHVVLHMIENNY